jgi:hypothetical protein
MSEKEQRRDETEKENSQGLPGIGHRRHGHKPPFHKQGRVLLLCPGFSGKGGHEHHAFPGIPVKEEQSPPRDAESESQAKQHQSRNFPEFLHASVLYRASPGLIKVSEASRQKHTLKTQTDRLCQSATDREEPEYGHGGRLLKDQQESKNSRIKRIIANY